MSYVYLLKSELNKNIKLIKNYPLDFIGNTITFIIVSTGIVFGVNKFGSEVQIFGMIFFPLLLGLIGIPSATLREDIEIGTFEQIFNGYYRLHEILIIRGIVNLIFSLMPSALIFLIIRLFFYPLSVDLFNIVFVLLLILINGLSIGMIFVGAAFLYKKVGSLINLAYTAVLFELLTPIVQFKTPLRDLFIVFAPFGGIISYMQNNFAKEAIINNSYLMVLSLLNIFLWLLLSYIIYKYSYDKSRIKGTLGTY